MSEEKDPARKAQIELAKSVMSALMGEWDGIIISQTAPQEVRDMFDMILDYGN